ncbi:MAG TPA: hypothetical protein VM451_10860, partial [Candidatus Limnocylindria bacterium]|nr:hypothetical protein [Candidatus Limnocylindria bacterium]
MTGQQVARVCQGRSPKASVVLLATLAAIVGLDLAARTFPGGQPLRDRAQLALLARLRARIGTATSWHTEVPVVGGAPAGRSDLRAWDAVVSGRGWRAGIEAETNVRDVQALLRRLELKRRDGDIIGGLVLALSDTRHHRELVRTAAVTLR